MYKAGRQPPISFLGLFRRPVHNFDHAQNTHHLAFTVDERGRAAYSKIHAQHVGSGEVSSQEQHHTFIAV